MASGDSGVILTIQASAGPRSGANLRVLITGAGGGVGYACARAFAARGADLILSDIDGQALKLASNNLSATGRFCDVASEASVAIFAAEVARSHGSIDVLINAAGKGYVRNLGTMRITRAFLPMMKSDGGKKHIVNVASMAPRPAQSGCAFPYAGSQDAFDRLSEALAENVRGTAVALTTVIPSPELPAEKGAAALAVATPHGVEHDDLDRVAAAIIDAVQSGKTLPGQATRLAGPVEPHAPDENGGVIPFERRAGKPRN